MLERADSYEELYRRFRWRIPTRYNIGVDVCDRQADAGAGTALIHVGADGTAIEHSFTDLKRASNRLANVLTAAGLKRTGLKRTGLKRGDRVGILLPQRPEAAVAHIAAHKAGMVSVPCSRCSARTRWPTGSATAGPPPWSPTSTHCRRSRRSATGCRI